MQAGPFMLDDAKVAEAKARFEANAGRRYKDITTFDEYLELFANDCEDFTRIGRSRPKPISREAVRLKYKKYFVDLFPSRNEGRARKRFCTLKRHKLSARELPDDGLIREVAELAVKNGLGFEKIWAGRTHVIFKKRHLIINNKLCRILFCSSPHRQPSRRCSYAHFNITNKALNQCDFLILVNIIDNYPSRYFVIPANEVYPEPHSSAYQKSLFVPLEKLPVYRNHKPKVNWLAYENAWHLLKD